MVNFMNHAGLKLHLDQSCVKTFLIDVSHYLTTGDLLVVDDEPVGHGRREFDGLQPESHVSLLQDLVVQAVFQGNNCGQRER